MNMQNNVTLKIYYNFAAADTPKPAMRCLSPYIL